LKDKISILVSPEIYLLQQANHAHNRQIEQMETDEFSNQKKLRSEIINLEDMHAQVCAILCISHGSPFLFPIAFPKVCSLIVYKYYRHGKNMKC